MSGPDIDRTTGEPPWPAGTPAFTILFDDGEVLPVFYYENVKSADGKVVVEWSQRGCSIACAIGRDYKLIGVDKAIKSKWFCLSGSYNEPT